MPLIDYSIKNLNRVVNIEGSVKNAEVTRLTAPGENFVSLVLRVDLEIEKNGHRRMVSTVAKRVPLALGKRGDMNILLMKNEINFYSEIVPLLTDFSREYGVDSSHLYAKYCGSRFALDPTNFDADREAMLLVENLIPQGYKNEDRYVGFDLVTSKAILESLALFHAVPIALRIKDAERFKILKEYLDSSSQFESPKDGPNEDEPKRGPPEFPDSKRPDQMLFKAMQDIYECAPYISKLASLMEKPTERGGFGKPATGPWATIGHSDFWVNNIMIKPRPNNKPLVKLVDFQLCRYRSFASDLVFFLLSSVNNDVQAEHFDDLLLYYYEQFCNNLKKFDLDLSLSYDEYLEEVETTARNTETKHAILFSIIIFGEKNSSVDVATQEVDMGSQVTKMIENMNQHHKHKLVMIASQVCQRNWV